MRATPVSPVDASGIDELRRLVSASLDPARKAELGQFMTPVGVARFMAALFSKPRGDVRLLDPGAGIGSLTDAFLRRWGSQDVAVTAYEIDHALSEHLRDTLDRYDGPGFEARVIARDFIQEAVYRVKLGTGGHGFTHAILNPPYRKIASQSSHRALLRTVGLETVNLYTAFLGLVIELMSMGGEAVAIVPRSFCNGLYYRPFREWLLAKASIEQIHLFHSRTSAFTDDEVLQENVIVKLVRGKEQGPVTITTSSDIGLADLCTHEYPFGEIVDPADASRVIHVPVTPSANGISGIPSADSSLKELGLEVSTGPVVDFRLKDFLRANPGRETVPLLYPIHFVNGTLHWPRETKKPNAMVSVSETRKWLYANGHYTVVRRFSSKEERRRIVAHVVDPAMFDTAAIGFENHLNVFHSGKAGIERDVAYGLAVFLNSTAVDAYFRRFSGHTQVNATDLRQLRYPTLNELRKLGRAMQANGNVPQEWIDRQVEALRGK